MSTKVNAALDRRAALRFGAVGAAATAAAVATTATAEAAAGQPVLQGRVNTPGATDTSIIAPTPGIAFTVKNTGTGAAGYFFAAKGNGFAGGTSAAGKLGLSTANTATVAGTGAAMGAVGVNNTGVLANTKNIDRFAVEAVNLSTVGTEGTGGGLYAEGGEAPGVIAISNVGVPAVISVGDTIFVEGHEIVVTANTVLFGATSALGPEVSFSSTVVLDGSGNGTYDLTELGVDDVDLSMATPLVSANSGPMPGLWIRVAGTLVQIKGGTAGGEVSFRVVGYRTDWGGSPLSKTSARRTPTGVDVAKAAARAAKERADRG